MLDKQVLKSLDTATIVLQYLLKLWKNYVS